MTYLMVPAVIWCETVLCPFVLCSCSHTINPLSSGEVARINIIYTSWFTVPSYHSALNHKPIAHNPNFRKPYTPKPSTFSSAPALLANPLRLAEVAQNPRADTAWKAFGEGVPHRLRITVQEWVFLLGGSWDLATRDLNEELQFCFWLFTTSTGYLTLLPKSHDPPSSRDSSHGPFCLLSLTKGASRMYCTQDSSPFWRKMRQNREDIKRQNWTSTLARVDMTELVTSRSSFHEPVWFLGTYAHACVLWRTADGVYMGIFRRNFVQNQWVPSARD